MTQPQTCTPLREFDLRFSSTPRGARLARRLVSHRLDDWGYDYDSPPNEALTAITAELAANAVRHGHVPGRDFAIRIAEGTKTVRVEVSDTRAECAPPTAAHQPGPDAESGRGLLLVAALATRWGTTPRPVGPGKTVWAECALN
ncbi:ATP-binding protein [Kitasatospora sp. NPDC004240]